MENGEKYVERIEKGEAEIEKLNDIEWAIFDKFKKNRMQVSTFDIDNIKIDYGYNDEISNSDCKSKRNRKAITKINEDEDYTEEEDKFIAYCLYKYGYKNWQLMKNEIRGSPRFMFNWRFQARTTAELQKRSDYIIGLFKKELDNSKPKTRKKIGDAKNKKRKVNANTKSNSKSKTKSKKSSAKDCLSEEIESDFKSEGDKEPSYTAKTGAVDTSPKKTRSTRNRKIVNY